LATWSGLPPRSPHRGSRGFSKMIGDKAAGVPEVGSDDLRPARRPGDLERAVAHPWRPGCGHRRWSGRGQHVRSEDPGWRSGCDGCGPGVSLAAVSALAVGPLDLGGGSAGGRGGALGFAGAAWGAPVYLVDGNRWRGLPRAAEPRSTPVAYRWSHGGTTSGTPCRGVCRRCGVRHERWPVGGPAEVQAGVVDDVAAGVRYAAFGSVHIRFGGETRARRGEGNVGD
jgi:hypothetical protein